MGTSELAPAHLKRLQKGRPTKAHEAENPVRTATVSSSNLQTLSLILSTPGYFLYSRHSLPISFHHPASHNRTLDLLTTQPFRFPHFQSIAPLRITAIMSHYPRTSRPKPPPPGNEEAAAILNLGEFQNVDTLTLSEAALVLNALVAKRRTDRKNVNETEYASCGGSCG